MRSLARRGYLCGRSCVRPVVLSSSVRRLHTSTDVDELEETLLDSELLVQQRKQLDERLTKESQAQVNDPEVLFEAVYGKLKRDNNDVDLLFPKEVIWLVGAPGSGKGTHAQRIMEARGITAEPIVMSNLLIDKDSQTAKNEGRLVADGYVLERLVMEMRKEKYENGVIVDGFPRNLLQASFVRLLHGKMKSLREVHGRPFRRPVFRVAVLWVPEQVSVERQLRRGEEAKKENQERQRKGLSPIADVERQTDFSEEKARSRYRVFKENYSVIQALQKSFHFTVIDATGSKDEVARALMQEFAYQSSLELGQEAFAIIDSVPTVSMITLHARQRLVQRLDAYAVSFPDTLRLAVSMIDQHLVPAVQRASIAGKATVRIDDPNGQMSQTPVLVDMMIDVMSDRGFHCMVEKITQQVPQRIDTNTGQVTCTEVASFRFVVEFPKSVIRGQQRSHRAIAQTFINPAMATE